MDSVTSDAGSLDGIGTGEGYMNYREEDPLAEVHRIRAEVLKEYGGMKGWHEHLAAERPGLSKKVGVQPPPKNWRRLKTVSSWAFCPKPDGAFSRATPWRQPPFLPSIA
jgi:hypothetical protein